jgi:putative inorganic carbon (HCO3(-)) transporter
MLLAFLLIVFAFIVYFKPTFAVGLILALLPTYLIRYQFHNIPTTFLELIVLIFIGLTLLKKYKDIGSLGRLGRINWFILAFVVAGVVSLLVSPDKKAALGIFKAFIFEPVLFFYATRLVLKKNSDLTTPLNLLFLSAIIVSVFGIIQYTTFIKLPLQFWGTGAEVERITSVFDYPNALSLYLAPLCSFFFAAFVFGGRVLNRKNLFIGLVIMVTALTLTFSRGAWLGFGITALVILGLKYPIKRIAAVAVLLILLVMAVPQTRSRIILIARDPSSSAHLDLMSAGLKKIEQSPIVGNGLFGFRTTLVEQRFDGEILNYPHNIFFNFWVEMGLLGLLSFFGIMFLSAQNYKLDPTWYKTAAVAYFMTLIIHGLVDVPYFKNDLSILFWFIVSVFFA